GRFSRGDRRGFSARIKAEAGDAQLGGNRALGWVAPAVARATAPPPPVPDPGWQRYVGRYRNAWGDAQVLVMGGRLTIIFPNLPAPLWARRTLVPFGQPTVRCE